MENEKPKRPSTVGEAKAARKAALDALGAQSETLTVNEAAALAHVSRHRIHALINAGALSYQPQGKAFLVKRSEVEQLLECGWRRNGE